MHGQDSHTLHSVSARSSTGTPTATEPPPSLRRAGNGVHETYELPFWSWRFTTDGETFYVTHHDPFPAVFALRPR